MKERIKELCRRRGITLAEVEETLGFAKGYLSKLDKSAPTARRLDDIAKYFQVSVDYLLGRTNDSIDYDNDGDVLGEIPLSYVEAAGGDMRKARAAMLAAEQDALREREMYSVLRFALYGDAQADISDAELDDIKRYAEFVRERKKK